MRKFYLRAFLAIAVVSTLWFSNPLRAYAETVTLTFLHPGSNTAAGGADYAYPYYFNVADGSGNTILDENVPLMCISFDKTINWGESWKADIVSVTDSDFHKEVAWLLNDAIDAIAKYDLQRVTRDQDAAWYLSVLNPPANLSGGAENPQLLAAQQFVAAPEHKSADFSHFQIFVPIEGTQPGTAGTPQTFIGVRVTPEPSNLILLGSGLALLAFGLYRSKVTA